MIETIGDLLKLLHRYPSITRLKIGLSDEKSNVGYKSKAIRDVVNGCEDEILLMVDITTIGEKKKRQNAPSSEAEAALEQCDSILEMCDEVPEKGEDFAESIRTKVESIASWISENEHVTPAQQQALDNMERAVSRWVERD